MSVKTNVLNILESNKGISVSGSNIASRLFITRSAVWKAIKSLQQDGYKITAVNNKGYCLEQDNDIISPSSIKPFLSNPQLADKIFIHKTLISTNTEAKHLAQNGAPDGTVIIADEQTGGRGRLGRSFFSPNSTGIYMSIIIKPKLTAEKSLLITSATAVAVANAIDKVCNVETKIKWVNDIYLNNKKVCGILTEASTDFESGNLEYIVIGIGINVNTPNENFPNDIKNIATSISINKPIPRSHLIAEILNNLNNISHQIKDKSFLKEYKKRSCIIGKEIYIIQGDAKESATAIDINDNAHLIVKDELGNIKILNSGDISIRQK